MICKMTFHEEFGGREAQNNGVPDYFRSIEFHDTAHGAFIISFLRGMLMYFL